MNMPLTYPANIIDCSAWMGNWAFNFLKYGKLERLQERLEKYNIIKAYVSPIRSILEEEPTSANLELFNAIDDLNFKATKENEDTYFKPVPVIDLSIKNWEDQVKEATNREDIKIVKLLPNYHMYDLDESILEKLVEYAQIHNYIISIQIRIEDARRHHPLMKVPNVDITKVLKAISYFPEQTFIIMNGFLSDLEQALYSLDNVYVDISSAESQNILSLLCKKHGADRLLFSTHSAFYSPEGNVYKLAYSGLEKKALHKIAYLNAETLGL